MVNGEGIRQLALEVGFSACGIAKAGPLIREKQRLENWISKDYQGQMSYLARDTEKRLNPQLIMDKASSLIMLAYHYAPDPEYIPDSPFKIARFALGLDYHIVLKEKMEILVKMIQQTTGDFNYRLFTDSAPVLEKAWAVEAGIGWIGKNTLLQLQGKGSWFLLCEIITDLEISADQPTTTQHCGNCRRCIDACPTSAITEPYVLDARKCLAYLSFEYKGALEEDCDLHGQLYGCDICQEVCPFNKVIPFNHSSWLQPKAELAKLNEKDWQEMDAVAFGKIFERSGILRNGYPGFKRNLSSIR